MGEELIGTVSDFFAQPVVAAIVLTGPFNKRFTGHGFLPAVRHCFIYFCIHNSKF